PPVPRAAVVAEGAVGGEAGDVVEADDRGRRAMRSAGGEVAARGHGAPAYERNVRHARAGAAGDDEDLLCADVAAPPRRPQNVLGADAPGDLPAARDGSIVEQRARGGVGELKIDDGVDSGDDGRRGVGGLAVAKLAMGVAAPATHGEICENSAGGVAGSDDL